MHVFVLPPPPPLLLLPASENNRLGCGKNPDCECESSLELAPSEPDDDFSFLGGKKFLWNKAQEEV